MPFIFTKYLLDDFDVPVVIEFSDDEKFFHKSKTTLEEQKTIWILNAKDFIACGFDMKKTFTFLSSQYVGYIYHNICKFQHAITYQQLRGIFGLNESDNCCKVSYPSVQAAPSLSSSFKHIQDKDEVMFLVTQGIDYFKNDYRFMLQTQGSQTWLHSFLISTMTLGDDLNVLLNNTKALQIQLKLYFQDLFQKRLKKVNKSLIILDKKHVLSGDCKTIKELKEKGSDLSIDVPYYYSRFFLEDDIRLQEIRDQYGKSVMMTQDSKSSLMELL